MKNIPYILVVILIVVFAGCSEENFLKPYGENDGKAPGVVTFKSYEKIPGGIIIKYDLPNDEDLMYVKARYILDTGKEMEAKASAYSNLLEIKGFGDEGVKKISLMAVDRSENVGEETTVEVTPGKPSYLKAFESIEAFDTFGGIAVSLKNEDKGNLIIDVMTQDSVGEWYSSYTEYSSRSDIKFSVRGFDTTPRNFKITVRDPWFNITGAFSSTVTPLYEKQMDRSKFRKFYLPTDTSVDEWGLSMNQLWSGVVNWGSYNMCHSNNFDSFPVWFTFDMGVKAKLSRYKYWQRLGEAYIYQHFNVKTWELWGHADTPPLDGSWDGWVKLIESESIKPSGRPVGLITAEDIEYATKGEEFEFPLDTPPVRYVRFKALSTFTGATSIHLQQLWFWGQEVE